LKKKKKEKKEKVFVFVFVQFGQVIPKKKIN